MTLETASHLFTFRAANRNGRRVAQMALMKYQVGQMYVDLARTAYRPVEQVVAKTARNVA